MKTNVIMWISKGAPVKRRYINRNETIVLQKDTAVICKYGSGTPGLLHVDTIDGEEFTVETGKGYLLGIK